MAVVPHVDGGMPFFPEERSRKNGKKSRRNVGQRLISGIRGQCSVPSQAFPDDAGRSENMNQTLPHIPDASRPAPGRGAADAPPRRILLQALARLPCLLASSPIAVSKLGTARWRIRTTGDGRPGSAEVYLSPTDGGLLYATRKESLLEILAEGSLAPESILNLGDCLIRAMADDARHIILRLEKPDAPPPEAEGLLESFGRHIAREGGWRLVEIRGGGQAARALAEAFGRGLHRFSPRSHRKS